MDEAFDRQDQHWMSRALELARRAVPPPHPNPRVGCVIVRDGQCVGEGWHARAGEAHAEVVALRAAGSRARGATVYVTLEPCCHHGRTPPCTEALRTAGVARVVAATRDPNPQVSGRGFTVLNGAGIATAHGVHAAEAEALNRGFISRMRRRRPWVRVKLAMSLDGRTAAASGESQWITGSAARADVQRLRAASDAILTGIGTVLADDPRLTVRQWPASPDAGPARTPPAQPLRVIVDSALRTPGGARLLRERGSVLIATRDDGGPAAEALRTRGAEVRVVADSEHARVDLDALMRLLGERQINEVLVEAGPILCGALTGAGLVDELVLYLAPVLLGDRGRALLELPWLERLEQRIGLRIGTARPIGDDLRIDALLASGDRPERSE